MMRAWVSTLVYLAKVLSVPVIEQLAGQRQSLGLRLRLQLEQTVKVAQRRRRALVTVTDVGLVNQFRTAAKNGFLLGRHLPAADQLLIQRQHELAFGDDRGYARRRNCGPCPAR